MKWRQVDEYHAESDCGTWLLTRTPAGFGIDVVGVTRRGAQGDAHSEAGHDAMNRAKRWCEERSEGALR